MVVSTNGDRDKAEPDDLWQRAAGDVLGIDRGPARISLSARLSLEKALAFLGEESSRVEVVELPGTITVHHPEPVIAHMASYRAWADQHDVPFDATIDRARTLVAEHIVRYGAYEITCLGGILACRRRDQSSGGHGPSSRRPASSTICSTRGSRSPRWIAATQLPAVEDRVERGSQGAPGGRERGRRAGRP